MSVRQAAEVLDVLQSGSIPINRMFNGGPIVVEPAGPLPVVDVGGLQITLLGPSPERLERLDVKWDNATRQLLSDDERESQPATEQTRSAPSDKGAEDATAPRRRQRSPEDAEWLAERIEELSTGIGATDRSVPNGSSIFFLAEYAGAALLVGADAYGSDLEVAVARLLAERGESALRLDAFVVPHAGSRRNLTRKLLEMLDCPLYVVGGDGSRFGLPDLETVAALIRYGRRDPDAPVTIAFNARSETNAVWASKELQDRYNYQAIYPEPGSESGLHIDFAAASRSPAP